MWSSVLTHYGTGTLKILAKNLQKNQGNVSLLCDSTRMKAVVASSKIKQKKFSF